MDQGQGGRRGGPGREIQRKYLDGEGKDVEMIREATRLTVDPIQMSASYEYGYAPTGKGKEYIVV